MLRRSASFPRFPSIITSYMPNAKRIEKIMPGKTKRKNPPVTINDTYNSTIPTGIISLKLFFRIVPNAKASLLPSSTRTNDICIVALIRTIPKISRKKSMAPTIMVIGWTAETVLKAVCEFACIKPKIPTGINPARNANTNKAIATQEITVKIKRDKKLFLNSLNDSESKCETGGRGVTSTDCDGGNACGVVFSAGRL